jgi:pSer/pThr/pTyr-binding forkhead associated (FHA) protein
LRRHSLGLFWRQWPDKESKKHLAANCLSLDSLEASIDTYFCACGTSGGVLPPGGCALPKRLIVISGLERGRVTDLADTDVIQLGCSQTLPVEHRFRDPDVGRVHCEIQVQPDRVQVTDAGMPDGTFINGKRINKQELRPGDVLRIGHTELRYLCDELTVRPKSVAVRPLARRAAESHERVVALARKALGPYRLEVLVGTGCWGRVYRARNQRDQELVALKVPCPEFAANRSAVQGLSRSLKTVAGLQHPHLLPHLAAGKTQEYCWIAMEYVDGPSLTHAIRRVGTTGLPDWRIGLRLLHRIGQALQAVHEGQLVHGHVSPQNILLRGPDKQPVLGDLLFSSTLTSIQDSTLTDLSERGDELAYVPPERTSGTPQVDQRSDLYSLGATAYALLTGRSPVAGPSFEETVERINHVEPVPPREWHQGIPDFFEKTLLKLLAKRPRDRFQSAGELLANLQQVAKFAQIKL